MKMSFVGKTIAILAVCLIFNGCAGDKAELVPVTGTVTIDGKAAADIMVTFVPNTVDESVIAPTSQAVSDASGNFDLFTTKNERGAIVGEHVVSLLDTTEERPVQGETATTLSRLDPKFASGAIKVTVKEGEPIKLEATGPD